MPDESGTNRRAFLRNTALSAGALAGAGDGAAQTSHARPAPSPNPSPSHDALAYPRRFEGRNLARIAFPLGGVGAGALSLGGRGQLRDWEIFNRPNKGFSPRYAFPAIWARAGGRTVARVLESRILPPYEGPDGLGSDNAPGLPRLESAVFHGGYPLAGIDFSDRELPVRVSLQAFSPFIPHDAEESGLPVAFLRYRVLNPGPVEAEAAIAFSIDNPVQPSEPGRRAPDGRANAWRSDNTLSGIFMTNPDLASSDPMRGSFAVALAGGGGETTYWRGWLKSGWWTAPLEFWDDFSARGSLGPEPDPRSAVASLCRKLRIPPGQSADFTFVLAWHFPNRTPAWCGWEAPPGDEHTVIGNHYATRFADAWEAASYAAAHRETLESRTRSFASAVASSTIPPPLKEAAMANLSTLASTTCFRTADGEFHGFEGVNDKSGCCFGNCTHVWNYETATAHLFPSLARSLRRSAFGYPMDEAGAIHFRQLLPDGKKRSGFAAADGQMGQILHAYLDWILSGDNAWLSGIWPRVKKALEFAWVPGGWDANRDGVLEGVQHNTYDVEFYGPNPQCGIYYLGALRAGEEMARAAGDTAAASEYRRLFEQGRSWIDTHLFNGEYYVQQVRGVAAADIAPSLRGGMGTENTEKPEYQVGKGCLVDQLVGQYLAEVAGLGDLLEAANIRRALGSVYEYNYKRTLYHHECVERTFALNAESALVICDYGKAERPKVPFPYFAEVMTGFEYSTAAHMIYAGMVSQGVECITNIRARYDGEKRNPWDEAECGHHYARAMAAWSGLLAYSGFRYDGRTAAVTALPAGGEAPFHCFWSSATAWGVFSLERPPAPSLRLRVTEGRLELRSCAIPAPKSPGAASARYRGALVPLQSRVEQGRLIFTFAEPLFVEAGGEVTLDAAHSAARHA